MALWNLTLLFGFLILCTKLSLHHAFPDGAPSSACGNMLPLHMGTQPQTSSAPYEFLVSAPSFSNGQPINDHRVRIQGRAAGGPNICFPAALGFWQTPPNNTKLLACSGRPDGAVTHANTNLKTKETTYTWLPPNKDCPKAVLFVATVAQSHDIYWTNVKSKVVWRTKEAKCGGRSFASAVNGVVVFSLLLSLLGYN